MERNLALELVRVTEAAALAAARENGRGDEMAPLREAARAAHHALESVRDLMADVVIGVSQSQADGLLVAGSRVGSEGREVELAIDALEGGVSCALGGPNAMSIMALAEKGGFLRCPEKSYMEKIATTAVGRGVVSLAKTPAENLTDLASAVGCYVGDLTAVILDRPRHDSIIDEVRKAGARVKLIPDGDVAAALGAARMGSGVDLLLGTGGASQGVLSAAGIRAMGGYMEGRFAPRTPAERQALYQMGIKDPDRILTMDEMASGDILFAATGVTDGEFLQGVKFSRGGAVSHSVVMRSASGTVRLLETRHQFDFRPQY